MMLKTVRDTLLICLFSGIRLWADDGVGAGAASVADETVTELVQQGVSEDLQEAYLTLFLDGGYRAEVMALISRDGDLTKLRYGEIQELLRDDVDPRWLSDLGEVQDVRGWIPVDTLARYSPVFNIDLLSILLSTPAAERDLETIDLSRGYRAVPTDALRPQPFSAYLNTHNLFTYAGSSHHYLLELDGALTCGPWVAEGRGDIDTERNRIMDYYEVRVIRDFPGNMTRLLIGEDQSFRPRLLNSDTVHGVKFSTEFNVQPNAITEPIAEYTFLLERDSLVRIWINGEEQKVVRLRAGPYDIRNFQLTTGFNEITLIIEDDLGNEEILTFNAVSGPNQLAPGRSEFDYSVGLVGQGSHYPGPTVFSAAHRLGLTDTLTGSVEGRFDGRHQGLGGGMDFACPYFYGSLDGAGTHSSEGWGGSSRLILARDLGPLHVTARFDYRSAEFLDQSQALDSVRIRHSEHIAVSSRLPYDCGNVRTRFTNAEKWEGTRICQGEVRHDLAFWQGWRLETAYLHDCVKSPHHDYRVMLTYTRLSNSCAQNYQVRHRQDATVVRGSLSGRQSKGWWTDWKGAYERDFPRSGSSKDVFNGHLRYEGNRFAAYYSSWIDDIGGANMYRHNFTLSNSIAYVDGQIAIGRPIRDAFALVSVPDALGQDSLQVFKGGRQGGSATPFMGAVIAEVNAYRPLDLSIEGDDFSFEPQTVTLYPTYRSGTHIVAGTYSVAFGALTVTGVLVNDENLAVKFSAATVANLDSPDLEPFLSFTNGSGRFVSSGFHPGGRYVVTTAGRDGNSYLLEVPGEIQTSAGYDAGQLKPQSSEER